MERAGNEPLRVNALSARRVGRRRNSAAPLPPCPLLPHRRTHGLRALRPNVNRSGAVVPGSHHEARRRFDDSRCSDHEQDGSCAELVQHQLHLERHLAEPADVRPHQRTALLAAREPLRGCDTNFDRRTAQCVQRAFEQRDCMILPCMWTTRCEPACSCRESTFCVQRKKRSPSARSSSASAKCAGFGCDRLVPLSPLRIELPHQGWISRERFRRCDVFHAIPSPQPVHAAKRWQPALGTHTRAGQNENAIVDCELSRLHFVWPPPFRYLSNHATVRRSASIWFSRLAKPCPSAG